MRLKPKRLAELIKKEVSEILQRKVSDPRIQMTSITEVELTPDLKLAKIYVSVFATNPQKKQESLDGIHSATKFIRGELAKSLKMRVTPEIKFIDDISLERGSKIISLMKKIENERIK